MPTLASVGKFLARHAKNGTVVYYTELYEHFNVQENLYRSKKNPIPLMLFQLVQQDVAAGRPLRSTVVVRKKGKVDKSKLIPADRYFELLCGIKGVPLPIGRAAKRTLHTSELEALKTHYGRRSKA